MDGQVLGEEVRLAIMAPSDCSLESSTRQIIEHKLLTALDDGNTVAILASKQDLEDMIAALYGYELGTRSGNVLSREARRKRCKDLAAGMSQLLREAFPPNDPSSATRPT